jgi:flavin reductase (DIM6/NTAB) family NADH-FMN oxidoreductase RutF
VGKTRISNNACPYPMPMVVVSAIVQGKVNHMAAAWITRVNASPPLVGLAISKNHHTLQGVLDRRAFGVSVPRREQARAVDAVGLVSGSWADKSKAFEIFYGNEPGAPLIASCPFNLACRLTQSLTLPTNELLIAEIVEAFCDDDCLADGVPQVERMQPFALTMPDNHYWGIGECLGEAWSLGKG